jgi:acyl-CoA reductase-like NAD-dependent aldehyde dehydrogenase
MATMFGRMTPMHFMNAAELSRGLMTSAEMNIVPGLMPYLKREPIGVVAAIVPWNIPLMIVAKIASALATGNTCIAKPPSVDSIGALQVAEMMAEHPDLPAGAVNVITGPGGTVGQALASHPDVGMVAFTGSCETGKAIMAAGASTVKRLFLELGGKNPFVVLEDADLEQTVAGLADAQYFNTGMLCGAPGQGLCSRENAR